MIQKIEHLGAKLQVTFSRILVLLSSPMSRFAKLGPYRPSLEKLPRVPNASGLKQMARRTKGAPDAPALFAPGTAGLTGRTRGGALYNSRTGSQRGYRWTGLMHVRLASTEKSTPTRVRLGL